MSNNFTRRNHYSPQRYQLGFANNARKVWLFDRKTLQYRNSDPINIGMQKDFYTTVDGDGVPNDSVEKTLASLEGSVWPVIDHLNSCAADISAEDRANLALFVAFMSTRTPAFDQKSNNMRILDTDRDISSSMKGVDVRDAFPLVDHLLCTIETKRAMAELQNLSVVALTENLPAKNLQREQVGTIVDCLRAGSIRGGVQ